MVRLHGVVCFLLSGHFGLLLLLVVNVDCDRLFCDDRKQRLASLLGLCHDVCNISAPALCAKAFALDIVLHIHPASANANQRDASDYSDVEFLGFGGSGCLHGVSPVAHPPNREVKPLTIDLFSQRLVDHVVLLRLIVHRLLFLLIAGFIRMFSLQLFPYVLPFLCY